MMALLVPRELLVKTASTGLLAGMARMEIKVRLAQQVLPEVQKWVAEAEQAEGQRAAFSEESLLYAKFRAVAAPLKQLMGEIERRRATNELCVEMLLECQGAFLQIRQTLLADVIRAHLEAMRGLGPPPGAEPATGTHFGGGASHMAEWPAGTQRSRLSPSMA